MRLSLRESRGSSSFTSPCSMMRPSTNVMPGPPRPPRCSLSSVRKIHIHCCYVSAVFGEKVEKIKAVKMSAQRMQQRFHPFLGSTLTSSAVLLCLGHRGGSQVHQEPVQRGGNRDGQREDDLRGVKGLCRCHMVQRRRGAAGGRPL